MVELKVRNVQSFYNCRPVSFQKIRQIILFRISFSSLSISFIQWRIYNFYLDHSLCLAGLSTDKAIFKKDFSEFLKERATKRADCLAYAFHYYIAYIIHFEEEYSFFMKIMSIKTNIWFIYSIYGCP